MQLAVRGGQVRCCVPCPPQNHPNILRVHSVSFAGQPGAETDGFFLLDFCPTTLLEVRASEQPSNRAARDTHAPLAQPADPLSPHAAEQVMQNSNFQMDDFAVYEVFQVRGRSPPEPDPPSYVTLMRRRPPSLRCRPAERRIRAAGTATQRDGARSSPASCGSTQWHAVPDRGGLHSCTAHVYSTRARCGVTAPV